MAKLAWEPFSVPKCLLVFRPEAPTSRLSFLWGCLGVLVGFRLFSDNPHMSDFNTNNNRRGNAPGSDDTSPSSTHPIRSAGGDKSRYSRNSDAYRVQRNDQASRRHRRDESTLTPVEDAGSSSRRRSRGSHAAGSHSAGSHSAGSRSGVRDGADSRGYGRDGYGRAGRADRDSRGGYGRDDYGRSGRSDRDGRDDYGRDSRGSGSSRDSRNGYGRDSYGRSGNGRQSSNAETVDRYNSRDQVAQYKARSKRKRTRNRIIAGIAGGLAVILAVCVVFAGGFVMKVSSNMHEGLDDMGGSLSGTLPGQPFYMLLVGTDESEKREASGNYNGVYRTDTMIVARVDTGAKKVSLISIPRDTMVDLGEEYGTQKINAAHALGGDSLAVEAAAKATGLPISHFAQIDFDGFKDVVDALGGIEVNVPMEIDDDKAGGHLDAGKQTLTGKQALILCRSRHSYDGVGSGDLYRAANQRLVLSAIVKKMMKSDPATMMSSVEAISGYVATDLGGFDLVSLLLGFRGFDTATGMYTAQFPTASEYIDGLWYEVTLDADWASMKSRLEQGLPPTEGTVIDEATGTVMATSGDDAATAADQASYSGTVSVRNGTDTEGLASAAASVIAGLGFTVDTGNANDSFDQTAIVYDSASSKAGAQAIKKALGAGTLVQNNGEYLTDASILVILGSDYKG